MRSSDRRSLDPQPARTLAGPGWASLSYLLITLALAYPLVRDIGGSLPNDLGDPVLNTWILWWNTTGLPFTERWWHPPIFFPSTHVLTYSEHLFGISLISTPVYWLTGSAVVAYNVAFLATFPLSGLAAYLLCFEITRRRDAAWLAGLAFAFAFYRLDHLAHIQVLAAYWMPLGLLALHRYYRAPQARWLVLFGVCTLMNGLTNGYFLLFYPPLILMWVLWFTPNEGWWRRVGAVAAAGAVAVLVLAPSLLTYQRVHDEIGLTRSAPEIQAFSADVGGLLSGPQRSVVWDFPEDVYRAEGQLFPGLTVVLLIAAALWRANWRPDGPEPVGLRRLRLVVGVASAIYVGAIVVRVLFGGWAVSLPGLTISTYDLDKLLPQGLLFWFLSALLSPVGAWAYRRHSAFAFYGVGTLLLFVLTLGPEARFLGHDFMAHSLYKALLWLPGYDSLRVPARFWMLATVCVSALVGLSFARLVPSTSRVRLVVLVVAALGIVAEGWVDWPTVTVPPPSTVLHRAESGVLELPLGVRNQDTISMLRSIDHGQPLLNGYSGYAPPHYWPLRYGLDQARDEMLDLVAGLGIRFVRVDRALDTDSTSERFVSDHAGARRVAEGDQEALFELPAHRDLTTPRTYGDVIDVTDAHSETNPQLVAQILDGSLATRWHTGPQVAGRELLLDLGRAQAIGAVVTQLGPHIADFPRALTIDVSVDGVDWHEVRSGPTDVVAVVGAMQRPREIPLVFPVGGRVARYIRLRSTASDPIYYWSIAELFVLAPE